MDQEVTINVVDDQTEPSPLEVTLSNACKKALQTTIRKEISEKFEDQFGKFQDKVFEELRGIMVVMREYRSIMDAMQQTNVNAEETLCNVLLAIRQNEYLQAWYPAQAGHPEMKVVGVHPIVQKRREIE